MKVLLMTEIDCEGLPIRASVEAHVPEGRTDLDMVLYTAMAETCRLLAQAARDDQKREHERVSAE